MKVKQLENTKLLYVAPRYHTNQIPIMHGFCQCGCKVMFLAQYEGIGEVHDAVEFRLLKKSWISKLLFRYIEKKYSPSEAEGKKMHLFIPAFFHTIRLIKDFNPDLVILRERYLTSAIMYLLCKAIGIKKNILYVQQPIYDGEYSQNKIKNLLKKMLFPKAVFSPICYHGKKREKLKKENIYFVPLVVDGNYVQKIKGRSYFQEGILHFLDIGKYREYKNHFFLIDVFEKLKKSNMLDHVKLTIIGQASNSDEEAYMERLKQYVRKKDLDNEIEICRNIPFGDMHDLYLEHDVLLLPSTYESAGMVILEAMEMGLCVATSIYCGLGSYLDEYQCGYTFDIEETQYLEEIVTQMIRHREQIKMMGQKSIEVVQKFLLFENYFGALNKLTEQEFGYTIQRDR